MSVPILKSSTKTQVEYHTLETPVIWPNFAIGAKGSGYRFQERRNRIYFSAYGGITLIYIERE